MVVAVTKIESDIIESFIRHTLSFADEILIADNGSFDGTQEILHKLQEENLPIHWKRLPYRAEFDHAGMMLSLLREAIEQHNADIVFPLDIDEFLINTENDVSVREILQKLDTTKVYHVHMYQYALLHPYTDSMQFLLSQSCIREPLSNEGPHGGKVIVGAEAVKDASFRLIQGCHYAYKESTEGDEMIPLFAVPYIHVAHFHWRCNDRYSIKTVLGWLGTASKYTIHSFSCNYMKVQYNKIVRGEKSDFDKTMGVEVTEAVDLTNFCATQQMRYGNLVKANLLPIALQECEKIAEAYAEEKVIRRKKIVSILIPFWGNTRNLYSALQVVKKQTYPHNEVFILNYSDITVDLTDDNADMTLKVLNCKGNASHVTEKQLSTQAHGDYVQWILPGSDLDTTHIQKMVAVFETQDFKFSFILANQTQPFNMLRPYLDLCGEKDFSIHERTPLWQNMLAMGKYPANGMDDVLIPSHLMKTRGWLLDCMDEDGVHILSMWRALLKEKLDDGDSLGIYAFNDNSSLIHDVSLEAYIQHQMDWIRILTEEGSTMSPDILQQALKGLQSNYHHILATSEAKDIQAFHAYQELMQALEE